MKRHPERPVLITDAARSQEDQLRTREVRYVLMMSVRIVCLLVAAALVSVRPPLLWLWLSLCLAGMVVVPWLAVVLANDRLPKEQHRLRRHRPDQHRPEVSFSEPSSAPSRTIEAEPDRDRAGS